MHIAGGRSDSALDEVWVDRQPAQRRLGWPSYNMPGFGVSRGLPLEGHTTVHTEVWTDDGEAGHIGVSLASGLIGWCHLLLMRLLA